MNRPIILVVFLCLIADFVQTAVISTLIPQKSPYFESGAVTLVQTTSTSLQYTCAITYKKAKNPSPRILLSYHTVEYDLNRLFTFNSTLLLNVNLYTSSSTNTGFIALAEVQTTYQLKLIKYSYFVMDTLFPYYSSFSLVYVSFNNKNSYYTVNHLSLNPIFTILLWGLNYEVFPSSSISTQLFGFHWQKIVVNSSNTQFYLRSTMTNYMKLQTKAIFMTIYSTTIPVYQYKLETFPISTLGSLSANYSSLVFSQGKSNYMIGLTNFYLQAHQNQLSPSFNFNIDILQKGLFRLNNQNLFSVVTVHAFIITRLECPTTYPFKKKNTTTLQYECHDTCALTQFEYFDDINEVYLCKPCLFPCSSCSSATICITCAYYMDLNSTFGCVLKNTYANVSSTIKLCSSFITGCLTCLSDATQCTSCQSQYVLSTSRTFCLLCSGLYNKCMSCTNSYCLVCNEGYILQTPTLCVLEAQSIPFVAIVCDQNCSKCDSLNQSFCLICLDKQHVLQNGICTSKCGDGKIMGSQECDDRNLDNFDGCSSQCKLEQDFQCFQKPYNSSSSKYNISECKFNKTVTFSIRRMIKEPYENKFSIYLQTPPIYSSAWKNVNLSSIINLSGSASYSIKIIKISFDYFYLPKLSSVRLLQQSYDPNNFRYIVIQFSYNQTIENKDLTIKINPKNSNLLTFSSSISFQSQINIFSHNNILANYYEQSYYKSAQILYRFSQVIGIVFFAMVLLGILLGNMMISLQASFMCQLSYFSLINIGQVNPLFYALSDLRFSSGYNIPLISENSSIYEENNYKEMNGGQMYSSFANNVNISLGLIILSLLGGGMLILISRYLVKEQQTKVKLRMLGSNLIGSVSFYLMHCFTFFFVISIAINFITNTSNPLSYIFMGLCCLLIIFLSGFFLKCHQEEYFSKLVQKIIHYTRVYLISGLVLKVSLAILIGLLSNNKLGCICVCMLYLIWSIIVVVKLKPYKQAHSIRLTSSLILWLVIQIIYIYQRLSTDSNPQQDINLYLPYSVISLLSLILVINLTYYFYSIKQIRCCQLEIQWQKVKDQQFVKKIKQIKIDDTVFQNQSKVKKNSNLLDKNNIQQPISNCKNNKKQQQIYGAQNDQSSLLSKKDLNERKLEQDNFDNKNNYISQNSKLSGIVDRQKIQQQIKKQLKNSQINPKFPTLQKKKKSNSNPLIEQTDAIYSKLKQNYFIAQEKELQQQQGHKKYVYTNQDRYCTYEQYNKL